MTSTRTLVSTLTRTLEAKAEQATPEAPHRFTPARPGARTISVTESGSDEPATRRLVGNFPQAFSHVGLVNSAFNLTMAERGPAHDRWLSLPVQATAARPEG